MFENVKFVSAGKFVSRGTWIHPDRCIDSWEIIFVIKGKVFLNEGGCEYELKENDILVLRPNVRHYGFKESENTSFYWMHWTCDNEILGEIKSLKLIKPHNLSILFSQLLSYSFENAPSEMLDYSSRLILGEIHLRDKNTEEIRSVNAIAEWIRANSDLQIKVSDIATEFGYNTDYISRLFKKAYKKTLKEYIDEVKTEHIKNMLLNTSLSLNEIASSCGFDEYKYFLKFFKYHVKMTPTEFLDVYFGAHINNK